MSKKDEVAPIPIEAGQIWVTDNSDVVIVLYWGKITDAKRTEPDEYAVTFDVHTGDIEKVIIDKDWDDMMSLLFDPAVDEVPTTSIHEGDPNPLKDVSVLGGHKA